MSDEIRPGPHAVFSEVADPLEALRMARLRAEYHEEEHPRLWSTEHIVDWISHAERLLSPVEEDRVMSRADEKDKTFSQIAATLGSLGTCDRKKVGCVIVRDGRCISWGFNGAPPGLPHCSENHHGWTRDRLFGKKYLDVGGRVRDITNDGFIIPGCSNGPDDVLNRMAEHLGCLNATHAEANTLAYAARSGISVDGGTCYVTLSPCASCARLLIAAGIKRVVWRETYRDPAGSQLLEEAGVDKEVILPDDYVH